MDTWLTDFRADLPKIDVPIAGGARQRRPDPAVRGDRRRLPALVADLTLVTVEGGPHNIGWTHPDEVNEALLDFLAR